MCTHVQVHWRARVLWERVALLRMALPSLPPRACAALYRGAPVLLCFSSAAVARRIRALALALRCSYDDVARRVRLRDCQLRRTHAPG